MSSTFTPYSGTFAHVVAAIKTFQSLLDTLEAHCTEKSIPVETFLESRLVEDMLPLTFQVSFFSDLAQKAAHRFQGTEPEQSASFRDIKTFDDARARLSSALEKVNALSAEAVEEKINTDITFGITPTDKTTWKAHQYMSGYIVPSLYFHVNMAYALLRSQGVQIGKKNYMQHFATPFMA